MAYSYRSNGRYRSGGSYRSTGVGGIDKYIRIGVGACVVFVGYIVFSYFKKKENTVSNHVADEAVKQSSNVMNSGRTYSAVSADIYHLIFADSWLFPYQLKNTDEAMLGSLVLKILPGEFYTLSDVYYAYKRGQGGLFNSNILQTTLSEDLKNVFSSKERQMYLGHLPIK
jgi:hypothetical protein